MHRIVRLAAAALAVALSLPLQAQTPAPTRSSVQEAKPASAAPRKEKRWRIAPAAMDVASEFTDNVFLLRDSRKGDVAAPTAADRASGRYADMRSASDLVTTLDAELRFAGPGAGGRSLAITPSVRYELYANNARRRNTRLGMEIEQSLGSGHRLRGRARLTPSYFAKNYLADAVDANSDGTIALGERVYQPGTYREMDLSMDYRRRLTAQKRGAMLQLGAGYYSRAFEAPFAGRDLGGPTAAVSLTAKPGRMEIELGYDFAALSADPTAEVLVLDEPDVGMDLNGNGDADDLQVRSVQTVDRSRTEHRLGAGLKLDVNRKSELRLGYEHRRRSYGSSQPLDVAYNGRDAGRNAVDGELRIHLTGGVHLGFGGAVASQALSRDGDFGGTGEIGDYTKRSAFVRLGFRR